jgi:hypothetical protein
VAFVYVCMCVFLPAWICHRQEEKGSEQGKDMAAHHRNSNRYHLAMLVTKMQKDPIK